MDFRVVAQKTFAVMKIERMKMVKDQKATSCTL